MRIADLDIIIIEKDLQSLFISRKQLVGTALLSITKVTKHVVSTFCMTTLNLDQDRTHQRILYEF